MKVISREINAVVTLGNVKIKLKSDRTNVDFFLNILGMVDLTIVTILLFYFCY